MTRIEKILARTIAEADTVEKVWELVAGLSMEQNGYNAETILKNVRAYAAIATKEAK